MLLQRTIKQPGLEEHSRWLKKKKKKNEMHSSILGQNVRDHAHLTKNLARYSAC